jgi:hypothetical protein
MSLSKKIQRRYHRSLLLIITAFLFVSLFALPALAQKDEVEKPATFTPQISIPGSEFQAGQTIDVGKITEATSSSDLLARYINGFYKYGLSIAGILATIMLMFAGVVWITSGGDSGKVGQAKKMIAGSLTGIIILACAWLILNTINPKLTTLETLEVSYIPKKEILEKTPNNLCCKGRNLGKYENGDCIESEICPANTTCKSDGDKFFCAANSGTICCEYKTKWPSIKKCLPVDGSTCEAEYEGKELITSYPNYYCNNTNTEQEHCDDLNIDCMNMPQGFSCYSRDSRKRGNCYNNVCLAIAGNAGEICGANSASKCLTGKCPEGYQEDRDGRDCAWGLSCCYKK